jgi:23S rRNA pseudouridine1911/1915/1917 synthase
MKLSDSEAMDIEILYEDNHLLFVNKPAGWLTQPTPLVSKSLEEEAKLYIKEKYQKSGAVFLHAIHRLDRLASGIVLFAKSSKALSRVNETLRAQEIKKEYLAIVDGTVKNKSAPLVHFLIHDDHKARVATGKESDAKRSELSYEVLKAEKGQTLLRVALTTGRYHQIRAQLAAISHPILGDEKYGSKTSFFNNAIALHHFHMELPHPVSKEIISVTAAPPPFWPKELLSNLSY